MRNRDRRVVGGAAIALTVVLALAGTTVLLAFSAAAVAATSLAAGARADYAVAPWPEGEIRLRKAPLVIYGGEPTQMTILWQLAVTSSCRLEWGEDAACATGSAITSEYGNDHQHAHTLTGLTPGALVHYRVVVRDEVHAGTFRAAPPPDAASLSFFAYGDTRSYPADHDEVAGGMVAAYEADPAFRTLVLCAGDLVNNGASETDWQQQFFDPARTNIRALLGNLAYQSCMGNHELPGALFTKYFPYPYVSDRYWSFDYGPLHVAVVDQYVPYGAGSMQLAWLESDLATTRKPWRVLLFHEPGWSAGGGHGNDVTVQKDLQPLCERYGVAVVFAGHNHYYARAEVNGVQHITTGGGGAPLRVPNPSYPHVVVAAGLHHFCRCVIDGDQLTLTAVEPDGTVIDEVVVITPVLARVATAAAAPPALLHPAAPNPFRPGTVLSFTLPAAGPVALDILDVGGRRVRSLVAGERPAGPHRVRWDGRDERGHPTAAGVYWVRLRAADGQQSDRIVRLR